MKNICLVLSVALIFCPLTSNAAITDYSGDETGFNAAISGLDNTFIDFEDEDLTVDDIISNQYDPPVTFLTNNNHNITAKASAWGTDALDSLCAVLDVPSAPEQAFVELLFSQPVLGVSLWLLDVHEFDGIEITLFNSAGEEIPISPDWFPGSSPPNYTHIAMLSDVPEIARFRVDTLATDEGMGFDNVTVVVPEPATVLLIGLGGLAVLRRRSGQKVDSRK